jgi:Tol biopolymer transport system component
MSEAGLVVATVMAGGAAEHMRQLRRLHRGVACYGSFYGPSALSPDGRRLAVIEELEGEARVVTFDARTGRRLRILTTGHRDTNPTWSPDGRWIAFDRDASYRAPRPNTQIIFASLWRVPADGGRSRRVTRRGYQPAWAS